jgi:hypothetical protein
MDKTENDNAYGCPQIEAFGIEQRSGTTAEAVYVHRTVRGDFVIEHAMKPSNLLKTNLVPRPAFRACTEAGGAFGYRDNGT